MEQIQEHQIAGFLRLAKQRLSYCIYISNYPKNKQLNYDTSDGLDKFYKNTCNVFFGESLLIISSLLSHDKRVISFFNWQEFIKNYGLEDINNNENQFNKSGLKTIRDQIIAHIDTNNNNNKFAFYKNQGIIAEEVIKNLSIILEDQIKIFREYAKKFKTPYSDQYFDVRDEENQIKTIMDMAKPKLTNHPVI